MLLGKFSYFMVTISEINFMVRLFRCNNLCLLRIFCFTDFVILVLASDPGPKSLQVCSPDMFGNCCRVWSDYIEVKWCYGCDTQSEYYVYKLKAAPTCDMAYCVGDGLACPYAQTWNDISKKCVGECHHIYFGFAFLLHF